MKVNPADTRAPWVREIAVGDVLRASSGLLRVVRWVRHGATKTTVSFSIKRCSWTTRCYTVYTHSDLKRLFRPTGKRMTLRRKIDRQIRDEIVNSFDVKDCQLHCCDVEGVS